MLTAQDIKKITAVVATKKDFAMLGKRLAVIEKKSTAVDARLGGLEISLIGIQQNFEMLNQRLSSFEARFEHMINSLDRLTSAFENLHVEYSAVSTQLSRHEEWIKKIAEKAGIKLEY